MSVRRCIWITKTGERREAWVVNYTDQTGARRIATFERKRDADAYDAEVRAEVRKGVHTAPSESPTVAEAGDLWITSCEINGLERATIENYRQHLRLHIVPYLGRLKLAQLSVPLIRKFEDDLRTGKSASEQHEDERRSASMIKRVVVSLGSLIADAQERGLVAQNVVRSLRAHRKRGKERQAEKRQKGKPKVGVDIPTPGEIKTMIAHLKGQWRPLLLTAIFTGLRSSELRGLRWADVDLKKARLHVRQRADRYQVIGKPKSEAGERTVPLPPIVVSTLREWKVACPQIDQDLCFPTAVRYRADRPGGKPQHYVNIVRRGFLPLQKEAGIVTKDGKPKYSGLHSLRHFYASWLINSVKDGGLGLAPKVVQERMGHSSISMTMDTYGHLFPRGDDHAELAAAEQALLS
jgi:integrase